MKIEKKIELILSKEEIGTLLCAIDIIDEMETLDDKERMDISNQIFDEDFCRKFRRSDFDFYDLKYILQHLCNKIVEEKD